MSATTTMDDGRRHRIVAAVVGICAFLGASVPLWLAFVAEDSEAAFADSELFGTNSLGAATLDLEIGESQASLGARTLAPGDVITGQVELVNAGTLPIVVSVTASTEGAVLAGWLGFEFWAGDANCDGPATGSIGLLTDEPAQVLGADDGAGPVAIAPETSGLLCVRASLPLAAPNELQDQRVLLDLTFNAVHDLGEAEGLLDPN